MQPPLFHYTSEHGLVGIARSGKLWASSIRTLNDTSEFSYAVNLARAYLTRERPTVDEAAEQPLNEMFAQYMDRLGSIDVFVACFSEREDSLTHWRGYCPPDAGYSIAFDHERLRCVAGEQQYSLERCLYAVDEQRLLIQDWGEKAISQLHATRNGVPPEIHARMPTNWNIQGLVEIAPRLKHPSFVDEGEWRLISRTYISDDKVLRRHVGTKKARYVEFDLVIGQGRDLVKEIWIGPPSSRANLDTIESIGKQLGSISRARLSDSPFHASEA